MSLIYYFFKYSGRLGLPFYFGRLEINGQKNIPKEAPYIIAPNHQSAFLDAILMGVYHQKPVSFLTRADVFVGPFTKVLEALNMMPVYRLRDGYEKLSKNEEVFARCREILSAGNPVLIFPEGNMGEGHFLRPLTKGTSRMAIQSQLAIQKDLYILPVGINYFHHDRPRYKCIINYGPTISVRDYLDAYQQHKAKGLIALRDELSLRIKQLLLIPEKEGYQDRHPGLNRHTEYHSFSKVKEQLDRGVYKTANYLTVLNWLPQLLSIANPLAIYVTHYIMRTKLKDRQFKSSLKYVLGYYLSVIWWALLFITSWILWSWKVAIAITICSILLLFIRSWLKKISDPIPFPLS